MESLEEIQKEIDQWKEKIRSKRKEMDDITQDGGATDVLSQYINREKKIAPIEKILIKPRKTLQGHSEKVYANSWDYEGRRVVSASQDGRLVVWDAITTMKMHAVASSWVMTTCFSPNGKCIASGGMGNVCSIYSLGDNAEGSMIRELKGHIGYVSCVKYIDDTHVLTSSGDSTCRLWDIETGLKTMEFVDHDLDVMSLSITANKTTMVTGSCDKTAKIWDVRTGKSVQTFEGHEHDVNSVDFFPNDQAFVTASEDGTSRLFDIRSDRCLNIYSKKEPKKIWSNFSSSFKEWAIPICWL